MTRPLVSICIPTYNGAKFISDCLQSVSQQTMVDYEVVLVDDNSIDDTVKIAQEFSKTDPRITIHCYKENSGGGGAGNYNRCLTHAQGEWIKFLFQDDRLTPPCLETMLAASGGGARFVMSLLSYFSDSENCNQLLATHENLPTLATVFGDTTYIKPAAFCSMLLRMWPTNFIGAPSASLIHAECFRSYGQFRSDFMTMADFEFWLRLASREGVAFVPEKLANFRLHQASTTSLVTLKHGYRNDLERLLTRFLMLHDSDYANFRDKTISGLDQQRLYESFITEARGAHWQAVDALKRNNNPSLMDEWDAFCARYPALKRDLKAALTSDDSILSRIVRRLNRPRVL